MRDSFNKELLKIADENSNIFLLTADIGFQVFDEFRSKFTDRFLNMGVAEANMIGVASGMTLNDKIPICYTIIPFLIMRAFEQIRTDVCIQNLPVKLVGVGGGVSYGTLGPTHHSLVDLAIMRSLPNMTVISPCDPLELVSVVNYCCTKNRSPTYLRIGKSGEKNISKNAVEKWKFGKIWKLIKGRNTCILSHGPLSQLAYDAINLKKKNISLYSCSTLKPFDEIGIRKIFKTYDKIITLEDHSIIGGLSDIVTNLAFKNGYHGKIITNSLKDKFINIFSNQNDLLEAHGISLKKIINQI